jgi:hypothetical protein
MLKSGSKNVYVWTAFAVRPIDFFNSFFFFISNITLAFITLSSGRRSCRSRPAVRGPPSSVASPCGIGVRSMS